MNVINKLFLLLVVFIIPLFAEMKSCSDLITTKDIMKCETQNFNYIDYVRQNIGIRIYIELPSDKKKIFIEGEKLWKKWFNELYIELDDPIESGQEGKIELLLLLQNHLKNHIQILQNIIDKKDIIIINSKIEIKNEIFNEYKNKFCQIVSKNICKNIGFIESNLKNDSLYFLKTFQDIYFYENPISTSKKIGIIGKENHFDILDEKLEYGKGWLKIQLLDTKKIYWIQSEDIINLNKMVFSQSITLTQKTQLYKTPSEETITKMYLIAGDKADLLEEKIDEKGEKWYNILYHGKKDINAWIKVDENQKVEIENK